jgi:adenine-specific DNA methylase
MRRRIKDRNHSPPKNNLIQVSEESEKNGYPVPESNKTKINDTKEPSNVHKNVLKEKILELITKNFMETMLDVVNQKCTRCTQEISRHQNKEYEKKTDANKQTHGSPK